MLYNNQEGKQFDFLPPSMRERYGLFAADATDTAETLLPPETKEVDTAKKQLVSLEDAVSVLPPEEMEIERHDPWDTVVLPLVKKAEAESLYSQYRQSGYDESDMWGQLVYGVLDDPNEIDGPREIPLTGENRYNFLSGILAETANLDEDARAKVNQVMENFKPVIEADDYYYFARRWQPVIEEAITDLIGPNTIKYPWATNLGGLNIEKITEFVENNPSKYLHTPEELLPIFEDKMGKENSWAFMSRTERNAHVQKLSTSYDLVSSLKSLGRYDTPPPEIKSAIAENYDALWEMPWFKKMTKGLGYGDWTGESYLEFINDGLDEFAAQATTLANQGFSDTHILQTLTRLGNAWEIVMKTLDSTVNDSAIPEESRSRLKQYYESSLNIYWDDVVKSPEALNNTLANYQREILSNAQPSAIRHRYITEMGTKYMGEILGETITSEQQLVDLVRSLEGDPSIPSQVKTELYDSFVYIMNQSSKIVADEITENDEDARQLDILRDQIYPKNPVGTAASSKSENPLMYQMHGTGRHYDALYRNPQFIPLHDAALELSQQEWDKQLAALGYEVPEDSRGWYEFNGIVPEGHPDARRGEHGLHINTPSANKGWFVNATIKTENGFQDVIIPKNPASIGAAIGTIIWNERKNGLLDGLGSLPAVVPLRRIFADSFKLANIDEEIDAAHLEANPAGWAAEKWKNAVVQDSIYKAYTQLSGDARDIERFFDLLNIESGEDQAHFKFWIATMHDRQSDYEALKIIAADGFGHTGNVQKLKDYYKGTKDAHLAAARNVAAITSGTNPGYDKRVTDAVTVFQTGGRSGSHPVTHVAEMTVNIEDRYGEQKVQHQLLSVGKDSTASATKVQKQINIIEGQRNNSAEFYAASDRYQSKGIEMHLDNFSIYKEKYLHGTDGIKAVEVMAMALSMQKMGVPVNMTYINDLCKGAIANNDAIEFIYMYSQDTPASFSENIDENWTEKDKVYFKKKVPKRLVAYQYLVEMLTTDSTALGAGSQQAAAILHGDRFGRKVEGNLRAEAIVELMAIKHEQNALVKQDKLNAHAALIKSNAAKKRKAEAAAKAAAEKDATPTNMPNDAVTASTGTVPKAIDDTVGTGKLPIEKPRDETTDETPPTDDENSYDDLMIGSVGPARTNQGMSSAMLADSGNPGSTMHWTTLLSGALLGSIDPDLPKTQFELVENITTQVLRSAMPPRGGEGTAFKVPGMGGVYRVGYDAQNQATFLMESTPFTLQSSNQHLNARNFSNDEIKKLGLESGANYPEDSEIWSGEERPNVRLRFPNTRPGNLESLVDIYNPGKPGEETRGRTHLKTLFQMFASGKPGVTYKPHSDLISLLGYQEKTWNKAVGVALTNIFNEMNQYTNENVRSKGNKRGLMDNIYLAAQSIRPGGALTTPNTIHQLPDNFDAGNWQTVEMAVNNLPDNGDIILSALLQLYQNSPNVKAGNEFWGSDSVDEAFYNFLSRNDVKQEIHTVTRPGVQAAYHKAERLRELEEKLMPLLSEEQVSAAGAQEVINPLGAQSELKPLRETPGTSLLKEIQLLQEEIKNETGAGYEIIDGLTVWQARELNTANSVYRFYKGGASDTYDDTLRYLDYTPVTKGFTNDGRFGGTLRVEFFHQTKEQRATNGGGEWLIYSLPVSFNDSELSGLFPGTNPKKK